MKQIEVNISQCLSSTKTIEVPDDFEYDSVELENYVRAQVMLPSDLLINDGHEEWYVDDFCVL